MVLVSLWLFAAQRFARNSCVYAIITRYKSHSPTPFAVFVLNLKKFSVSYQTFQDARSIDALKKLID